MSVCSARGTVHLFPITPYGGPITCRTHLSTCIVNRTSQFQRSAGLDELSAQPFPYPCGIAAALGQTQTLYPLFTQGQPNAPGVTHTAAYGSNGRGIASYLGGWAAGSWFTAGRQEDIAYPQMDPPRSQGPSMQHDSAPDFAPAHATNMSTPSMTNVPNMPGVPKMANASVVALSAAVHHPMNARIHSQQPVCVQPAAQIHHSSYTPIAFTSLTSSASSNALSSITGIIEKLAHL